MDKINPTDEQGGLMGPVNVIPAGSSNMNGSSSGGVKATFQNLKTYIVKLWTEFLALSIIGKLVLLVFGIVIVAGIVLIPLLNVKLHYPSGTGTTTCNLTYSWNSTGTTFVNDSALESPQGIYINNGIVYISDAGDIPSIHSITTSGTSFTTYITSTTMSSPQGIYIDQSNNIYVPDYDNACVYKFTSPGSLVTPSVAVGDDGNPGSALNQLDGPMVIVFDSTETYMFVADSSNDRIIRFSTNAAGNSDGVVVASGADSGVNQPSGLFYDSIDDYLYIGSSQSNVVLKWKPFASTGTILAGVLNTGGSTTSLLYGPGYVIHDRTTKQLYVADIGNSRIMAYCDNNAGGTIIAGTSIPGSLATQLSDPYEFGFDTNWNLYVLDSDNNRVQKFTRL